VVRALSGSTASIGRSEAIYYCRWNRFVVGRRPVVGWFTQRLASDPAASTHPVLALFISLLSPKMNSDGQFGRYEQIVTFSELATDDQQCLTYVPCSSYYSPCTARLTSAVHIACHHVPHQSLGPRLIPWLILAPWTEQHDEDDHDLKPTFHAGQYRLPSCPHPTHDQKSPVVRHSTASARSHRSEHARARL